MREHTPIESFDILVKEEIAEMRDLYEAEDHALPDFAEVQKLADILSKAMSDGDSEYTYRVVRRKKYILIDRTRVLSADSIPDVSGFLMVGPGEGGGIVYGTKGYGVVNLRQRYGTLFDALKAHWSRKPAMANPSMTK